MVACRVCVCVCVCVCVSVCVCPREGGGGGGGGSCRRRMEVYRKVLKFYRELIYCGKKVIAKLFSFLFFTRGAGQHVELLISGEETAVTTYV